MEAGAAPREIRRERSKRQRIVLALVSKWLRNKDIAALLGFSKSSTQQPLRSIFAKLEVAEQAQSVAAAITRGTRTW